MFLPSKVTVPAAGCTTPAMPFRIDDLPFPFPPTMATISPRSTLRDTSWMTGIFPYLSCRFSTLSIVFLTEIGLDDPFVVDDFVGQPLGDLLAVIEYDDLVGDRHDPFHDMLDENQGQARFPELQDKADR